MKTALLIIDMQVDFCSPEGLSAKRGRGMRMINEMLPRLQEFYQFAKHEGIYVVFTKSITDEYRPSNIKYRDEVSGSSQVCLRGSGGEELYVFSPASDDDVIEKYYFEPFAETDLATDLHQKGVTDIFITGVRTDICVDATAKRAFSEGFNVYVLSDLVATSDERINQHESVLEILKKYHSFVITSEEAKKMLQN